ncbi:MAG: GNAT family N-acetyltransferase [Deltaproteobacteria bacterium]|nr:GNAT family N-acetyltransferase [Deltaproteobacteria bacterium]
MDIRIVDFEPEHYDAMPLRAEDAEDLAGMDRESLLEGWEGGFTVMYNGEPAFFYGGSMDRGCGMLWAVSSPLADKLPLLVVKLAREMVKRLLDAGCHRIEAYCHTHNARSLAWLTRSVGFSAEGVIRKSGPNAQDRFILSIVV